VIRKLAILLLLTLVLAFVFAGCKGKPEIPPPPPPPVDTSVVIPEPEPEIPPPAPLSLTTIHFDYDKYNLTAEAREILAQNAASLEMDDYSTVVIRIEGHCDERGSDEYNMALGEKRAATARDYLINYGISPDRISIISYGESRPVAPGANEDSWARNRRGEFIKISE